MFLPENRKGGAVSKNIDHYLGPDAIARSVSFYLTGFADLPFQNGSQDQIPEYRSKIEKTLNAVDQKITDLLKSDTERLIFWAARMKMCTRQFRVLEKNLAFKGKPHWDWAEVISAMSLLEATKECGTTFLGNNGIELDIAQSQPESAKRPA